MKAKRTSSLLDLRPSSEAKLSEDKEEIYLFAHKWDSVYE
jgi:hypothetical protein